MTSCSPPSPSPLALRDVKKEGRKKRRKKKKTLTEANPKRARAGDRIIKMLKMSVLKTDTIGYLKL